jgi:hypothetical protein
MGQYYIAVNLDKKQFISPHACGDGAKLLEFALGECGMLACLAILLADGNGRGGGDLFGAKCTGPCGGKGYTEDSETKLEVCPVCHGACYLSAGDIVGSWAGDRVVIAGDYGDQGKFVDDENSTLYATVQAEDSDFENVSLEAMRALAEDRYVRERLQKRSDENDWDRDQLEPVLRS